MSLRGCIVFIIILAKFFILPVFGFNLIYEKESIPTEYNGIDKIVFRDLRSKGLSPANLCSDGVFIRRVYLDIIGALPTVEEVESFLNWDDKDKRILIVKDLLSRKEHAEYWGFKFGDALCIKAEFPVNLWPNAAQAYSKFIVETIFNDVPYDTFTRSLLTSSGSNFREPEVNFYRAMQSKTPEGIATAVCRFFMGLDYSKLSIDDQKKLANFFSMLSYKSTKEWKEEIVFLDPAKRSSFDGEFIDGKKVHLEKGSDPRIAFANWLTSRENKYFVPAIVNRLWTYAIGIPVVSSIDDMWNGEKAEKSELLKYLSKCFIDSGYSMRKLLEEIFTSYTYQQSSLSGAGNSEVVESFGAYRIRQLEAEVLIDIICATTGTSEIYSSTTPEPYTTLPNYKRSVALPDGSITSSFLELFGRSARDTGLYDERVSQASASQRLHLINSEHIKKKILQGPLTERYASGSVKAVDEMYLRFLSRYPSEDERVKIRKILKPYPEVESGLRKKGLMKKEIVRAKAVRAGAVDIVWALINSEEFLNRH